MIQPQTNTISPYGRVPEIVGELPELCLMKMSDADRGEALQYLSKRPMDTVIMAGWMRANGVVSPFNRGTFYCCRKASGELAGVALIGPNTLIEADNDSAIKLFADLASTSTGVKMLMGESGSMAEFWRHFSGVSKQERVVKKDALVWRSHPVSSIESTIDIRLATLEDADQVVKAHACLVHEETGIDPLINDPDGFASRCRRRIESGKVWIHLSDEEMLFKVDVVSETDGAVYAEGLWVHPDHRRTGIGGRGLRALCGKLLNGQNAVCGFVDDDDEVLANFYADNGFIRGSSYTKIYL